MNKKYISIIVLILLALYFIATFLGLFLGLGAIGVYTDKNEYKLGDKVTIYSKNNGIAILCGVPYWYIYKINDSSETLVYWDEVKGPQCKWPQGYFGTGRPVGWDPSAGFNYGNLNVGPQKEGKYKVVVMVRSVYNTSDSKIITVR